MALMDLFGLARRRVAPTQAAGTGGAVIHGGYLDRRERNAELQNTETRYRAFGDVLTNVSVVAAGVRYFTNLVGKAGWKVEPNPKGGAEAERVAELVREMMGDMTTPWPRVVRRASMFRFYGFSLQEWTAKRRPDGLLGMRDVEPRPQFTIEQWDVDDTGTVQGVGQRSPQTGEILYLPRGKLVYAVDDTLSDSPEGLGILRNVMEPARRLQAYEKLEAFGYETDLRGIPKVRAPLAELERLKESGALTTAQVTQILQPMADFVQKHIRSTATGVLIDSQVYATQDEKGAPSSTPLWDVELLQSSGESSAQAIGAAIDRLTREIARVLGVEHLLLGGDGRGSLALSRDKTQNFGLIVDSTLTELTWVLEQDWLRPLALLNGWPDEVVPTLKTEQVQYRDVEQITGALRELADAGAALTPGDPAVDEVRDLLGLSRTPEEVVAALQEMALMGAAAATTASGGGQPAGGQPAGGEETDDDEVPPSQDDEE